MTDSPLAVPAPLGPFFGRERELAAAAERLRRPDARLVTLTGPPGIGKTTLAEHLIAQVAGDFPDGVVRISLEAIHDTSLVVSSIASALKLPPSPQQSQIDQVAACLSGRDVLLFLDNFEQIIDAAPVLPRLLERAERATCLVTSREALDVRGEYEIPVPPLPVPDMARFQHMTPQAALEAILQYPSVRLFCERATAVGPEFRLTAANASQVASACLRLDGIPLALELAAARLKVLSLEALEGQLARATAPELLDVLGRGRRDSPERHRTLVAAIDWSYQLLDDGEQRVFRALAIFVDGWSLDAADTLLDDLGLAAPALEVLSTLVGKSLVHRSFDSGDHSPRWGMFQALRSYALMRLRERPDEWRAAHTALYHWALDLIEQPSGASLDRLEAERANLRGILEWSLTEGEADAALRLGAGLWRFWLAHSHLFEGRRLIERILDVPHRPPDALLARVLYGAAMLARQQGDRVEMRDKLTRALDVLASCPADAQTAAAIASASVGLGRVLALDGQLDQAVRLIDDGLVVLRQSGAAQDLAGGLTAKGMTEYFVERHAAAAALLEEAAALYRSAGDQILEGDALATLGLVLADVDPARARVAAAAALRMHEASGYTRGIAKDRAVLGRIAYAEGNFDTADTALRQAVGLLTSLGDLLYTSYCLVHLSATAAGRGRMDEAVRFAAAAQAFAERTAVSMLPIVAARHRQLTATLRGTVSPAAFARDWAEGTALRLEDLGHDDHGAPVAAAGTPPALTGLTSREAEVLALVASGLSDADVAERLFVSARTVHAHLRSIYGKLDVKNRTAAGRYAIEHGMSASPIDKHDLA